MRTRTKSSATWTGNCFCSPTRQTRFTEFFRRWPSAKIFSNVLRDRLPTHCPETSKNNGRSVEVFIRCSLREAKVDEIVEAPHATSDTWRSSSRTSKLNLNHNWSSFGRNFSSHMTQLDPVGDAKAKLMWTSLEIRSQLGKVCAQISGQQFDAETESSEKSKSSKLDVASLFSLRNHELLWFLEPFAARCRSSRSSWWASIGLSNCFIEFTTVGILNVNSWWRLSLW